MTAHRKDDHVRLAHAQYAPASEPSRPDETQWPNQFDEVRFVHHALTGTDREKVSLTTRFAGVHWPVPLYINAMTGGSPRTGEINRDLAIAARETGLPIATGSMSPYLKDPGTASTFSVVRREHPDGFVLANLNAGATPEQARRAVGLLDADALQIHLNTVQETVMPEGDRAFSHWAPGIARIAAAVDVPVIVKEVGFGLSGRTVRELRSLGVHAADVAGSGGTNFARIENDRRDRPDYAYLEGWGLSTPAALLDARDCGLPLLASGGVRHPLDIVRALALGAHAVGASGPFLTTLLDGGVDALVRHITTWLDHLTALMTLLGAHTPDALAHCDVLLTGSLRAFCLDRGLMTTAAKGVTA
ncbi:type 2 isopentenyl-diphosphate Delta-isomerase [Streptomyces capillispiralis]|uniref:Isopentenyl-diphosphate delta-isomerase n=1 Tax=Streptomyces capillispiralis TaxID=68182 RepID=A0A561SGL7_9ACTN|nr:type 2 isopentenyl-diphosphate Delta-isomerase [Streptomyces capillispiralis]TWF73983.1 isopentenyl-diphosphate delta-isomerase [Streptomyces capillispiralis]GHH96328.1 isopentenyl-diphosphate delta-isomerase [Streptomyces capillispiralis]